MMPLKPLNNPKLASSQGPHDANSNSYAGQSKVIRDGFSMPEADYEMIAQVQATCLAEGFSATKSGVLRAALHALLQLSPEDQFKLLQGLVPIKQGRPRSSEPTI